ncbi:hypothetical protein TRV_06016 [Trichophyton verrucosum HKI 0517]|uniref:Uncharacterized protein n=1 Tax=Trichophyton verrucosum (strain HKI 0517) TaxID=663202 RepID=D4DFR5_TRIVH|nr:uncharacterized protein TRV_06016 [Trichophyton verrucosum HKI 0517]EFE39291.1 hypothetical protein TRV_06016 [Trichophyton verrucosum HKI 0517]
MARSDDSSSYPGPGCKERREREKEKRDTKLAGNRANAILTKGEEKTEERGRRIERDEGDEGEEEEVKLEVGG